MYAMQYVITLPADYDMGIIRHRVTTKGPLLDTFSGLGLKAYLIRERGVDHSPVNQYAPFYLWATVDGMTRFLWGGGGFSGFIDSFGRPQVQNWAGVACRLGPAHNTFPNIATRHIEKIPADIDPAVIIADLNNMLNQRADMSGVHSTAIAIDPQRWEFVHFTLWHTIGGEVPGIRYQVLHLSKPYLREIL
jgi:hypothetical protein